MGALCLQSRISVINSLSLIIQASSCTGSPGVCTEVVVLPNPVFAMQFAKRDALTGSRICYM